MSRAQLDKSTKEPALTNRSQESRPSKIEQYDQQLFEMHQTDLRERQEKLLTRERDLKQGERVMQQKERELREHIDINNQETVWLEQKKYQASRNG
jgi:hypothetical protein